MTPREAGEAAFYECEGNNAACLKAAFDAYEAAAKARADERDGLDCGCGGGWKVGHMPGCPDAQPFSPIPVPEFGLVAKRKLDSLVADGWAVNGYALIKGEERRGFIDFGGFVGWWLPEYYQNHTPDASKAKEA